MFLNNCYKKGIEIISLLKVMFLHSIHHPISRCIAASTCQGPRFTVHFRYNAQLRNIVPFVRMLTNRIKSCRLRGRKC
jgi:hypothetical protein